MYTVKIYNGKAQKGNLVKSVEFKTRKEAENFMYKHDDEKLVVWLFEDDDYLTSLGTMKIMKNRRNK